MNIWGRVQIIHVNIPGQVQNIHKTFRVSVFLNYECKRGVLYA
jgi:hypothetical protein